MWNIGGTVTDKGNQKFPEKHRLMYHLVHYKCHRDDSGTDLGLLQCEADG
jgi:hypothetical protein